MIKGKLRVNWFSADDIRAIDDTLPISDFANLVPFYDALEEYMLDNGFVLWDDEIVFDKEILVNGLYEIRYNCAVVKGIKRGDKFIVNSIGIAYYHIKNNTMTDFEKLVFAYNHLSEFSAGDKKEKDSIKAKEYLNEVIDKMKRKKPRSHNIEVHEKK